MSSEFRYPSQIAPSGTYITTADLSGVVYTEAGVAYVPSPAIATGSILYDMGRTVYIYNNDKSVKTVLRRVQQAVVGGNGQTFFIVIGGDKSLPSSPVARL